MNVMCYAYHTHMYVNVFDACCFQKLKFDLLENFDKQLQEVMDDFVQEVEKIEQSHCNGSPPPSSS